MSISFVDSHCHLQFMQQDHDIDFVINNAIKNNVNRFLCVATKYEQYNELVILAEKYNNIDISIGFHPTETSDKNLSIDEIVKLAQHEKIVAIGETGLDYYRETGDLTWQQDRFKNQIQAAIECKKPLIIHTRSAKEDTLKILKEVGQNKVTGVLHCFTEDWDMAKRAIDLGFYISISGIVTFKNAKQLQEVAKLLPLDRMLIETDAPYLAPVPYRGKINEPAYVKYVAQFIADLREVQLDIIAKSTTENYYKLFSVK